MNKNIIKITSCLIILGAVTSSCYGYSKTLKDEEYVSLMNNYIAETSNKVNHKGGSQWKALFGNVEEDYLKPEIDKLNLLKAGTEGLKLRIADLKIRNKDTKEDNNKIISLYGDIISLLDIDITAKEKILNSKADASEKYGMIKSLDHSIEKKVEKKFYEVNMILQNIEVESIK